MLKVTQRSRLQINIPGVGSISQRLEKFSETQSGVVGEGTLRVEEMQHMILRISVSTIKLQKLRDLISKGYCFVITSMRYGGMSYVEKDEEEAFSFLNISSTSERVRRVTGS